MVDDSRSLGLYVTVIAGAITVIAFMMFSETFPYEVRYGSILSYLVILVVALLLVTDTPRRLRTLRSERKRKKHWRTESAPLLETMQEVLHAVRDTMTSSDGTIDFLVREFFDKPVAFNAQTSSLPSLEGAIPGFHDSLSAFGSYAASIDHRISMMISRPNHVAGHEIRVVIEDMYMYFNAYSKWSSGVFEVLKKHNTRVLNKTKIQEHYLRYRDRYAKAVSELDRLKKDFNTASGRVGSEKIYTEPLKREQEPFLS